MEQKSMKLLLATESQSQSGVVDFHHSFPSHSAKIDEEAVRRWKSSQDDTIRSRMLPMALPYFLNDNDVLLPSNNAAYHESESGSSEGDIVNNHNLEATNGETDSIPCESNDEMPGLIPFCIGIDTDSLDSRIAEDEDDQESVNSYVEEFIQRFEKGEEKQEEEDNSHEDDNNHEIHQLEELSSVPSSNLCIEQQKQQELAGCYRHLEREDHRDLRWSMQDAESTIPKLKSARRRWSVDSIHRNHGSKDCEPSNLSPVKGIFSSTRHAFHQRRRRSDIDVIKDNRTTSSCSSTTSTTTSTRSSFDCKEHQRRRCSAKTASHSSTRDHRGGGRRWSVDSVKPTFIFKHFGGKSKNSESPSPAKKTAPTKNQGRRWSVDYGSTNVSDKCRWSVNTADLSLTKTSSARSLRDRHCRKRWSVDSAKPTSVFQQLGSDGGEGSTNSSPSRNHPPTAMAEKKLNNKGRRWSVDGVSFADDCRWAGNNADSLLNPKVRQPCDHSLHHHHHHHHHQHQDEIPQRKTRR